MAAEDNLGDRVNIHMSTEHTAIVIIFLTIVTL